MFSSDEPLLQIGENKTKHANKLKSVSLLNSRALFRFFQRYSSHTVPLPPLSLTATTITTAPRQQQQHPLFSTHRPHDAKFSTPSRHQLRVQFLPPLHMRKWNRLKCEFVLWRRSINGNGVDLLEGGGDLRDDSLARRRWWTGGRRGCVWVCE